MRLRICAAVSLMALLPASRVFSQEEPPPPQTPRQALVEMLSGAEDTFVKHLTIEVQAKLQELDSKSFNWQDFAGSWSAGTFFATGPVLYAYGDRQQNEIRVDDDAQTGDEAVIRLSWHLADNPREAVPKWLIPTFLVALKRQDGIWRLNKTTTMLELPIGDPDFISLFAKEASSQHQAKSEGAGPEISGDGGASTPDLSPEVLLDRIVSAEQAFAGGHPETGFTCSMADLVKAMQGSELLDPQIAKGSLGGYNFWLTGCSTKPSGSFHALAEPVNPGEKAFCTDATRSVRFSDDGRGTTCIGSGKFSKTVISAGTD
jgi:hypothetical protein